MKMLQFPYSIYNFPIRKGTWRSQGFTYFLEDILPTALWQTRLVSQLVGFRFAHSKMPWHAKQAQPLLPDRSHYRNSTTGVPTANNNSSLFQNQSFTNTVMLPVLLLPRWGPCRPSDLQLQTVAAYMIATCLIPAGLLAFAKAEQLLARPRSRLIH